MAALASAVALCPSVAALKAQISQKACIQAPVLAAPRASLAQDFGKAAIAVSTTLLLATGSANALTVKMGGDDGSLAFVPKSATVAAGESITFVNNAGFPHNVVFDEDEVPEGVNADAISHEDYFNAPGDSYTITLDAAGEYSYYCEPHQGAGMVGKLTVS
eukprot:TRINITY_DN220_c0_g1_i1.p1 TRINITY_DN220_c0_g1~~TRINITY_DN220_c0_g1_i1.p1  ORF type:complete len:161 (-),score=26.40 TRINITY_DN220_c0_g1_i1:154-636(-)